VRVTDVIWGTADAIVLKGEVLYVRDLKYGANAVVEAEDNKQLKIYALAALLTVKGAVKYVDVGIVQPRAKHPDGPIRSVRFPAIELIDFYFELVTAEAKAREATESFRQFQAGARGLMDWQAKWLSESPKACRWCPVGRTGSCPIKNQNRAKRAFAKVIPVVAAQ
jgi:hypothetical protein